MRTLGSVVLATTMILAGCGTTTNPAASGQSTPTASAALPAASDPVSTSSAAPPTATPPPVPLAEIVTGDATTPGIVGSYTIDGRGSDGPWLPFTSLPAVGVGTRETPTLQFSDGTAIRNVQVLIASAADTSGTSSHGVSSTSLAADGHSVAIGPLPAGQWVIAARLFRADGRGDGTTYWAVTVQ